MFMLAAVLYAARIFSFNSLSEAESVSWLSFSELFLMASSVLLFFGILGEFPELSNWKESLWYKAAKWAVLLGVAGELLSDGGIFRLSARLQLLEEAAIGAAKTEASKANERAAEAENKTEELKAKNLELEAKIAPRDLSSVQIQSIADAIRPFAGMHFDLSTAEDIEPMRLLDKVEDALKSGGWIEQPDTSPSIKFNRMGASAVAVRTVAGVWVLFPTRSGPEYENAAKALRAALDKQGLVGNLVVISGEQSSDLNVIHVSVGGKP